jgi:hypothetical protein
MSASARSCVVCTLVALMPLGTGGSLFGQERQGKGLNTWLLRSFLEDLDAARELGIGCVRIELPWELVQPNRDEFDWARTDAVVEAARANQIQVLFTLRSVSSWGTRVQARRADLYHHASSPRAMPDWERFVGSLASRYKGRAVDYEIENEVNVSFWDGSREDYLELLRTSYQVIKARDPGARVLCSAMACGVVFDLRTPRAQESFRQRSDAWLRPILATQAFDVVSVHDYYFPSQITANGWTFSSYLKHVTDLMMAAEVGARPVWMTEAGYVSRPTRAGDRTDDGSPQKQALWLAQAYEQARTAGVERIFWLFLRDSAKAGYFGPMGLMDAQGARRPAWTALTNVGRR